MNAEERSYGAMRARMFIDGKRVDPSEWMPVRNPARLDEVVGDAPQGTAADAALAVDAADRALGEWRRTPVEERAALLAQAGSELQLRSGEWQELLTREHGKILFEAGLDLQIAGAVLEWYGTHPELLDDRVLDDGRGRLIVRSRPIGVCAGIVPWNWPVVLSAVKIGPALLAGNTFVLKAPDFSPLATLEALAAIGEMLPPGVLNLVAGPGLEVGGALVSDPRVGKIAFTGGVATGKAVMADAARTLKRVTLELGGNDPALLLEDVELSEDVAANLMLGAFSTSGQICFAIKRVYVHRSRYAELVDLLQTVVDTTVVGDGLDPEVTMGPLNNERQFDSVQALLDRTRAAGLDIRSLGRLQDDAGEGYFVRPHLVLDPPDDAEVVACEQFGPVLPVLPFDDEEEVIARANGTPFGLCSSVWTADENRAFELAGRLDAGTTFINGHSLFTVDLEAPFGGTKDSGIGRELGPDAVREYVETHSITNKRM
jgi:aldehyde dehydrogenase